MAKNKQPKEYGTAWKDDDVKVIIGMPCADSVTMKAKTAHAVGCAIIRSERLVVDFILKISCDIVANRTALVKDSIARGATHILFVDSDMYFPADTIKQLVARDKDIIGVEYNKRQFPLELVLDPMAEQSKTEPYQAKYVGTGVLLIKLSVFEKMTTDPWFNFGRDSQGQTTLGEDVWFCNVARDAGFDIWIDPTIKVGHLGEYTY